MPELSAADTIRILVATDSHVGYNERDHIRGNDSWQSFDEVMCLAKEQDVDMVLLAGDLFHENKPSRKSMYQVMRSLRMNCLGEKPCELEMLSDASENFQGAFNHVNYEDPDINVAIPVFSIHGNHDDPSGEGHLCALDLLQVSGLMNYYGRTPESDNIAIKPVLLQKGRTKLALYGMSNVRDERLFRTFRDGKVRFFRPDTQQKDWFNLMAVHQNHHSYTETGYLPENFLPDFLDFVVWGHEHECIINPRYNPDMSFHVMQPGSSVATSLVPGEAVTKHVALLSITGLDFKVEPIRLKTVRPFVMREIILNEERGMKALAKRNNNRSELTRYLEGIVNELIDEANAQWREVQNGLNEDAESERPLPLVRLRVEYSAPDGGKFETENPQRFSNRFVDKVANVNDVVQFYTKKATKSRATNLSDAPDESIIAELSLDNVKVEKLVREFLTAQSLTILPQNSFGDAVSQFVDKDDKHAMELFVDESLSTQMKHLMGADGGDEDEDLQAAMDQYRSKLEELFAAGRLKKTRKAKLKPHPEHWNSDLDGEWADQPGALMHSNRDSSDPQEDQEEESSTLRSSNSASRGRGRGRGSRTASTSTRTRPSSKDTAASKSNGRSKAKNAKAQRQYEEEDPEDVIMLDDDEDDDEEEPAPQPTRTTRRAAAAPKRATTRAAGGPKQAKLNFSSQPAIAASQRRAPVRSPDELSDDNDDDDDDDEDEAFQPMQLTRSSGRSARGRR